MNHKISVLTMDGCLLGKESLSGIDSSDVLGIAVQTEVIGLILSIDDWEAPWGEYDELVYEERDDAKNLMELSGVEMTKRIIEFQNESGYTKRSAAKICAEYNSGGRQFYFPCVYELCTIQAFSNEINEILEILGLPLLSKNYYWSSSEGNSIGAVLVSFSDGYINNGTKHSNYYVRAVSAFPKLSDFSTSCCEHSEQCALSSLILSDEELVEVLRENGYRGTLTKELVI